MKIKKQYGLLDTEDINCECLNEIPTIQLLLAQYCLSNAFLIYKYLNGIEWNIVFEIVIWRALRIVLIKFNAKKHKAEQVHPISTSPN